MPIFFGHRTAELLLNKPVLELLAPSPDQDLEHCQASRGDFQHVDLSMLEGIPQPYDVLVSSPEEIRKWEGVRCHVCQASLPGNSFVELTQDVFVAAPALCLIQRAQDLSLVQTIALADRFCGTFALDKRRKSGVRERSPLTTRDEIGAYLDRCGRVRGIRRARRALSFALDNAASPMETITRLVFCLPHRLGGFGFSIPRVNYEIVLNAPGRRITGKSFIRIDLFWKDFGFGLEYQGRYSHTSATDIGKDIARQLAAERKGILLQMITIDQIRSEEQRWEVARKISRNIGEPIPSEKSFRIANQRLADELLTFAVA